MKYLDEYRDRAVAGRIARNIRAITTGPWRIMEICGGQTHTIMKYVLEDLLPPGISLLHGPGCPVCVTPLGYVDKAISLAMRPDVIVATFGDMLRVPGSLLDLLGAKAAGGNVKTVYSPLDALRHAEENPRTQVVFFAVGFETTAPATALTVWKARETKVKNFSVLCAHVLVPPAIEALLSNPAARIDGFLAAGHVCTVMGFEEYIPLAARYEVPIVVTGFEPVDILEGIYMAVRQLESHRCAVENQYARAVRREGNIAARRLMGEVFDVVDRKWRGIGVVAKSGLSLSPKFAEYDAGRKFELDGIDAPESALCSAGLILQGLRKPDECRAFGSACSPEHPLGAPMVSPEGACAAYIRYRKEQFA